LYGLRLTSSGAKYSDPALQELNKQVTDALKAYTRGVKNQQKLMTSAPSLRALAVANIKEYEDDFNEVSKSTTAFSEHFVWPTTRFEPSGVSKRQDTVTTDTKNGLDGTEPMDEAQIESERTSRRETSHEMDLLPKCAN
jgi:hypothetical protein